MSTLVFDMPYTDSPKLIISPEELIKLYMHGVPLCDKNGQEISNETINQKILDAQSFIENLLYIKINEQIVHETSDFDKQEWHSWGYVKTTYPVNVPLALDGIYNSITQIGYPMEWLTSRKEDSSLSGQEESVYFRQIHLIPAGNTSTTSTQGVTFNSLSPHLIYLGLSRVPNFWHSSYVTGFKRVPTEIINVVGQLAAIQALAMLGDTFMGVGMNSYSISLDGLSQNTSLLKSNEYGVYGSRIKQFYMNLFGTDGKGGTIANLKAKYVGINWNVV